MVVLAYTVSVLTNASVLRRSDDGVPFYTNPPDLAAEVVSPSESANKMREKTRLYLEASTQVVWNVYPDAKLIDTVRSGDTFTSAPALPNLTISLEMVSR